MLIKEKREFTVPVSPKVSTTTYNVRDFTRTNPQVFYNSTVEEDPQDFIDHVDKVLMIM